MTKLIALITAGLFAAATMFAGEHGDCTKQVGNETKMACRFHWRAKPDARSEDKDGRSHGGASQGWLQRGQ